MREGGRWGQPRQMPSSIDQRPNVRRSADHRILEQHCRFEKGMGYEVEGE